MLRPRLSPGVPRVPGPGTVKVRQSRPGRRAWLLLVALAVAAALWRPLAIGESLDAMRRDFVAMRYLKSAAEALRHKPVNTAAAAAMVDRALELAPDNDPVARQAGFVYLYAGAYDKAAQHLIRLPERDLIGDIHLGHSMLLAGQDEEGRQLLQIAHEQVLRRATAEPRSRYQRAIYLNEIGYSYAVAGIELDRAVTMLREAVQLQPLEPAFIDSLGWAYYQRGEYRRAMFYLERAVRLAGPQNTHETYYHLGAAYARMGYIRRAARALAKALEYAPDYEPAADELQRLGWELPQPIRV